MNQILYTGGKQKSPIDTEKIVKFFCIIIMIFGVALIGKSSYALITNKDENVTKKEQNNAPTVNIDKVEDKLIISVTHDKEIDKIVYNWNNDEENTIDGNGRMQLEEEIDIPVGTNTFNIRVIDIIGEETTYSKEYLVEATKPVINLDVVGKKIKISATDSVGLSYITYRWDNSEEIKIDANELDPTNIEQEIDIEKGQHTLTVVAVNINNETEIKEQEVKGVSKPEVSVGKDGEYLVIKASDEQGLERITYTLNDKKYTLKCNGLKEMEYRQKLNQGENVLKLEAYNSDGAVTEFKGKATL